MPKDEGLLLDMLLVSREIQGHLGGKDQASFRSERLPVLAVQQLLTIIGEAPVKSPRNFGPRTRTSPGEP